MNTSSIFDIFLSPITRLITLGEQGHWLTYLAPIAISIVLVTLKIRSKKRKHVLKLDALFRMVFPKRVFAHKSTKLDVKLYFFSAYYLSAQTLVLGSVFVTASQLTASWLTALLGPLPKIGSLDALVLCLGPVFILLLVEFGYWLGHYAMHKLDFLWPFHKVHHSAPVMTPLTEWRQHPVEFLVIPCFIGMISSLGMGILIYLHSGQLAFFGLWAPGFIIFIFMMTILHLRHSHVKLNFPPWLGTIVQSPMQHQLHHSTDPEHYDRNFGFCLSVWDFAFGTLTHPKPDQAFDFGLRSADGPPEVLMNSDRIVDHLWIPFIESANILKSKIRSALDQKKPTAERAPDTASFSTL